MTLIIAANVFCKGRFEYTFEEGSNQNQFQECLGAAIHGASLSFRLLSKANFAKFLHRPTAAFHRAFEFLRPQPAFLPFAASTNT
ncbi:hypothetical protein RLO149_c014710 [Roseobacter litoralis Och 149]|uniref:Uncharacterized protein n=1 Tax=Roseobacter litoralis (strain ATCC 49566 / DSM 6996 / JCM 21268 / NBRC 15278 / OCh 149) TaxID=391595 RepID=F7ZF37_ROSLO|nr:hypothetical protein RLO149_c014710 [Roseobacter litoralis Och 149]